MDIFNNTKFVQLLAPQVINNTDTNSSVLDTQGFERRQIIVALGDLTGLDADSTLELLLQESDDTVSVNFVAVPVAAMLRDVTGLSNVATAGLFKTLNDAAEDQIVAVVEYIGSKRYIRARLDFTTGTGGITAAPVAILGVLTEARHAVATPPAPTTAS